MFRLKVFQILIICLTVFSTIFLSYQTAPAQKDSPHYLIGPNDALNIFVWRETELTRDVTVMSDGRISYPLIGNIMVQGKTVTEIEDTITTELKKFVDAPEVTVIVNASGNQIYTIGNVNAPGPYPLFANMTVLQVLSAAGGFAEWADTKNIIIIRSEDEKQVQLRFNYKEFIAGKKVEQNIILMPNDTIVVP